MRTRLTSAAVLMAALAVLVGVAATGGCLPERTESRYVAVRVPAGPPAMRPEMPSEEFPPLPPQEQPPQPLSALPIGGEPPEAPPPMPSEERLPGAETVPSLSLPSEEETPATEVLTSGPVHEAFAEPVDLQPEPGLVVPQEPPADIQEVPPEDQPDGADVAWVPGYWAWDADRQGFVWVSGCWRAAPPDTHWVPGYWVQVPDGWQWVSGFWQQEDVGGVVYIAETPPVQDVEPPGPAPAEESVWVPPCPYWQHDRYVVRRGYWLTLRQGWVWVPSHYVWTPRGYVFIRGHWDFALDRRGVLFAPVYFPRVIYLRHGFVYRPVIVVDLTLLTGDLFVYPRYCHYYFGDYYDDAFLVVGIYPWCDSFRLRKWWDPIFVYDRWRHRRTDPLWEKHKRDDYDRRRADRRLRPPRTYGDMLHRLAGLSPSEQKGHRYARPFSSVVAGNEGPRRFHKVSTVQGRQRIDRQANDVRTSRREREQRESTGPSPQTGTSHPGPRELVIPPRGGGRGATSPDNTGRGAPSGRSGRGTLPTTVQPTPRPTELVPPSPSTGDHVPPPGAGRGRGTPPSGRGESSGPRGSRGPIVLPPEPRPTENPSPGTGQTSPPSGRGPRAVQQPQGRGGRGSAPSSEQIRLQQWARDQQEAVDRRRQQHEHSAEQARQQQWARDQQEAADRRREQQQATQRARQQQEQDRSRSREDTSGGSAQDSGGGRGRRSGR